MRDFEEEYKKYIDEETPDLWNRIESQLEDRETTDINLSDRAKDRKISDKTVAKTTNKKKPQIFKFESQRFFFLPLGQHNSALADTKRGCLTANSVVLRTNDVASPTMLRLRRKYTLTRDDVALRANIWYNLNN